MYAVASLLLSHDTGDVRGAEYVGPEVGVRIKLGKPDAYADLIGFILPDKQKITDGLEQAMSEFLSLCDAAVGQQYREFVATYPRYGTGLP